MSTSVRKTKAGAAAGTMAGASETRRQHSLRKLAKRYAIAAIGCAAFALIYAQFSHGVHSPFMTFMFAIPLVGGAAIALGSGLAHVEPPRKTRQAWALAIASLTVASCLRGIFEIAGTASPLLPAYLVAAAIFAAIGFANEFLGQS